MNTRYDNRTTNQSITLAIKDAERLLSPSSSMMTEIQSKNDFKYSSGTGAEVCTKILNCKTVAPVFTFRPWNPWTASLGYSDGNAIYINVRRLPSLDHADLVGLLCHEWLHLGPGFGHGNNYGSEDKNRHSVNYFASENVKRWL